jgi:hypothetical protein
MNRLSRIRPSRTASAAGLLGLAVILSACLVPPSASNTSPIYAGNGPDPSWTPIHDGLVQVFTTDAYVNNRQAFYHIPSYFSPIPNPHASGSMMEALPILPTIDSGASWAPSVRYIDGQFVMLFSESVAGRANCIAWATSPNGQNFLPADDLYWCSANPSVGFLDPDLFVDPSGNVWLIYSQQNPGALASVGGSQLVAHPLIPSGMGIRVGSSDYTLITYDEVESMNPNRGPNPFIENPSMTSDHYNHFDLTFSLGTYTSNSTEITGEVPCLSANGNCIPGEGADIMKGSGGASMLDDASPAGNWMIWHTWSGSNRVDYGGQTSEINENPSSAAREATSKTRVMPIIRTPIPTAVVPYTWWPRVVIPGKAHLVIGYTGPRRTISMTDPPVTGSATFVDD